MIARMTMAPSMEAPSNAQGTRRPMPYAMASPEPEPTPKSYSDRKTVAFGVNYEPSLVDRFYSATNGTNSNNNTHTSTTSTTAASSNGKTVRLTGTFGTVVAGSANTANTAVGASNDNLLDNNSNENTMKNTNETVGDKPAAATTATAAATPNPNEGDNSNTTEQANANAQTANSSSNNNNAEPTMIEEEQAPTTQTPSRARRSNREQKQRSVNFTPVKVRYDMELVPSVEKTTRFWNEVKVWPPRIPRNPPPPAVMPTPVKSKTQAPILPPVQTAPTPVPQGNNSPLPNSVIWEPTKRKEWEDSISELIAVCTSAALRKHTTGKFVAPLSREYIRDRIDIDDPLRGYQIRHATGGWLQGFCLWTNFTTWTHYFTWDSLHPQSGLADVPYVKDADGSLSAELQALPRSGDPSDSGIVFEKVAEIALLGALGCGELLLRMALEEIVKSGKYKFIILQATASSRAFYERFGFQRVGAVCRYGNSTCPTAGASGKNAPARKPKVDWTVPTLDTPIQGYRHWTHANESQQSLDLHGGPSYMMCLKIPDSAKEGLNLLDYLSPCFVSEKPTIGPLGAASTPNPKRKVKRSASRSGSPPLSNNGASTDVSVSSDSGPANSNKSTISPGEQASKRRKVSMDKLESILPDTFPGLPSTSTGEDGGRVPRSISTSTRRSSNLNGRSGKDGGKIVPTRGGKSARSGDAPATPSSAKKGKPNVSSNGSVTSAPPTPAPEIVHNQCVPMPGIQPVNKTSLVKQKVKSYPRDRLHFFNKVVAKNGTETEGPFYFVLHYDPEKALITICPMSPKGILSGKRQGRPRFQCDLLDNSSNWIVNASTDDYSPVPAFMVMKTPLIAQEAWDIMGEP
eukprot:Nitzschia sp. Nitz4//scaffold127_size64804//28608//31181//NITZ4_006176-RA/size64804-processed-gene-0.66-mRNA-1//1//CDS//3329534750//5636//frame0